MSQNPKLPVSKENVEIIYQALSRYKKSGEWQFNDDAILKEQTELKRKLDECGDDIVKKTDILLDAPESERLSRIRAFKKNEADLDILIAKLQILRKRLESSSDEYMIDDLLGEFLSEGDIL